MKFKHSPYFKIIAVIVLQAFLLRNIAWAGDFSVRKSHLRKRSFDASSIIRAQLKRKTDIVDNAQDKTRIFNGKEWKQNKYTHGRSLLWNWIGLGKWKELNYDFLNHRKDYKSIDDCDFAPLLNNVTGFSSLHTAQIQTGYINILDMNEYLIIKETLGGFRDIQLEWEAKDKLFADADSPFDDLVKAVEFYCQDGEAFRRRAVDELSEGRHGTMRKYLYIRNKVFRGVEFNRRLIAGFKNSIRIYSILPRGIYRGGHDIVEVMDGKKRNIVELKVLPCNNYYEQSNMPEDKDISQGEVKGLDRYYGLLKAYMQNERINRYYDYLYYLFDDFAFSSEGDYFNPGKIFENRYEPYENLRKEIDKIYKRGQIPLLIESIFNLMNQLEEKNKYANNAYLVHSAAYTIVYMAETEYLDYTNRKLCKQLFEIIFQAHKKKVIDKDDAVRMVLRTKAPLKSYVTAEITANKDRDRTILAIAIMEKIGEVKDVPVLFRAISESDDLRGVIIPAIAAIFKGKGLKEIMRELGTSEDLSPENEEAKEITVDGIFRYFFSLLSDSKYRSAALYALGDLGDVRALPKLLEMFKDSIGRQHNYGQLDYDGGIVFAINSILVQLSPEQTYRFVRNLDGNLQGRIDIFVSWSSVGRPIFEKIVEIAKALPPEQTAWILSFYTEQARTKIFSELSSDLALKINQYLAKGAAFDGGRTFEADPFEADYYIRLGVRQSATPQEIKKAYRELSKKYHPDTNHSDKSTEEAFKNINEANEVLSDPEKRKHYDMFGKSWKGVYDFYEKMKKAAKEAADGFFIFVPFAFTEGSNPAELLTMRYIGFAFAFGVICLLAYTLFKRHKENSRDTISSLHSPRQPIPPQNLHRKEIFFSL